MPRPSRFIFALLAAGSLGLIPACAPAPSKPQAQRPDPPPAKPVLPDPPPAKPVPPRAKAEPARQLVAKAPPTKPSFDDKDMVRPINQFREHLIEDYRMLPNCLEVFAACIAVPFEGKTSDQYKASVSAVARRPCRVILKLVDVSADYDYGNFELLRDDGMSALDTLKDTGDLGKYTRHLKAPFAINQVKKKGLDKNRSIGDRVVLVGLGDVVNASSWGAANPSKGMPRGDERYVMLRAFGKPNSYHPNDYEFAFMVRNWYIASQGPLP